MELKFAQAQETRWVDVKCEMCSNEYSCQVDSRGFADTGFVMGFAGLLPSDKTMIGAAQADLRENRELGVARVPCPHCGNFSRRWVDAVQARARKIVGWGAMIGLFVALFGLLAVALPDMPVWTLLIVLALSWLGSKVLAAVVADRIDPNRNLHENKQRALAGVQRGVLRVP